MPAKTEYTRSDIARATGTAPASVFSWIEAGWLRPLKKRREKPPVFDETAVAAALVYAELTRGGVEHEIARGVAIGLQEGDDDYLATTYLAAARSDTPGIILLSVFEGLDDEDIAELRQHYESGRFVSITDLRELRDSMLVKVRQHRRGASLLARPTAEGV